MAPKGRKARVDEELAKMARHFIVEQGRKQKDVAEFLGINSTVISHLKKADWDADKYLKNQRERSAARRKKVAEKSTAQKGTDGLEEVKIVYDNRTDIQKMMDEQMVPKMDVMLKKLEEVATTLKEIDYQTDQILKLEHAKYDSRLAKQKKWPKW